MKETATIKSYAVELTKQHMDKKFKHKTCQYSQVNKGGARYCTLTTNKSCTKCTFYDPTIQEVFEALAKEIQRAQSARQSYQKREKQLKTLINKVKTIESDMDRMHADANREYKRLYIAKHENVQLWEDSVNTYGM